MQTGRGRIQGTLALSLVLAASIATAVELGQPEVAKIGWSTGSLVAADIDADDRTDLVIINNDRARIELLLQREPGSPVAQTRPSGLERWQPILSDARFERRSIATGSRMFALSVGDLDGDGRADIAYSGTPDGLTVRYQDRDGVFDRKRLFDISDPAGLRGTVVVADVDDDARVDLVVLTKTQLLLFRQSSDGTLEGPESWRLSDSCFAINILDVDGDGRTDITYQTSGTADSLRVRHGLDNPGFGPEVIYDTGSSRGVARSLAAADHSGNGFVRIQSDTGLVEHLTFKRPKPGRSVLSNALPRVFAVPIEGKTAAAYALGDLDGNGLLDIAAADPRGARIWLIRQNSPGKFSAAEEFPSLADIRSLVAADHDNDGRDELIMASPKERTLAWARLSDDGALELPSIIPTEGKPQAVAAADFDGDGRLDLAYATVEKRDRKLLFASGASGWNDQTIIEIEELDTDPADLRVVDLNGDQQPDLVLFVDRDALRLIVRTADGSFREIGAENDFRRALVDDVEPSALTTGDVTGDGVDEMIIASSGFARAMRLDDNDNLEVLGQFNARSSDAAIASACVLGAGQIGDRLIALLEPTNDRLQLLSRRRGGVWRFLEAVDLPAIDLVEVQAVDLDNSGTDDLVLFGADRLVWLPVGADEPTLTPVSSWESDLEGVNYQLLGVGDLDADGQPEVVAIDTRDSHVLEVLQPGPKNEWKSLLHFTVFEVDPHYEGQRGAVNQPREIVIADVTNDGLDDLLLVIHDRVLLYPQMTD